MKCGSQTFQWWQSSRDLERALTLPSLMQENHFGAATVTASQVRGRRHTNGKMYIRKELTCGVLRTVKSFLVMAVRSLVFVPRFHNLDTVPGLRELCCRLLQGKRAHGLYFPILRLLGANCQRKTRKILFFFCLRSASFLLGTI
jgi:hypothetical protein